MDEGPYEADTTEEKDTTNQAASPTAKDAINIYSNDDNDEEDEEDINSDIKDDGDVKVDNTLHPWTARKQRSEEREEESLLSKDSENYHDDNEHDDHYSE